ncbi:MAG: SitI3 family protein [Xenococcaceae cyanobacterium]
MDTDTEPKEALLIISKKLNIEVTSDKHLLGQGVLIGAIKESTLARSQIEEEFGFRPTIDVRFRINPKEEYQIGKRTVLRATIELLSKITGDAVLLHNGENLVLKRIKEKLILNKEWGNWNPMDLAELSQNAG